MVQSASTVCPQELDEDYLVGWGGLGDKPRDQFDENELRDFLLECIDDGHCSPTPRSGCSGAWLARSLGQADR